MTLSSIIASVVGVGFLVLAYLVAGYVVPILQSKDVYKYVQNAVYAAEQTLTDPKSGQAKKAKVKNDIVKYLSKHDITFFSDSDIDIMIESAVHALTKLKSSI